MSGPRKNMKRPRVQIQEDNDNEIFIKEKEMFITSGTVVRSVPVVKLKINNSVISHSNGVMTKFENHELPKGYKPKPFSAVNTQKSSEVKTLKMKKNPEEEGIKGFTNNLKVALQTI